MASKHLFLLAGDGIGPEAMAEVKKLIAAMNDKFGSGFVTDEGLVGGCAYDAHGAAISDADSLSASTRRMPSAKPSGVAGVSTATSSFSTWVWVTRRVATIGRPLRKY